MKRNLLGVSVALPIAMAGAIGLNCGDQSIPYAGSDGGPSSMPGNASGGGSGSSSGGVASSSSSSGVASGSGSSSGVASGSSSGGASSGLGIDSGVGSDVDAMPVKPAGGTVADIFGIANKWQDKFMDSLILFPCYSNQAQDCITIPQGTQCPHMNDKSIAYDLRGTQFDEYFQLGGTVGQMYQMTFTVQGITEAKYYTGGTCIAGNPDQPMCKNGRAAGEGVQSNADTNNITNATDAFYTGGTPVDQEFYNVYKMVVLGPPAAGAPVDPATGVATPGQELQHYYLNSFPSPATTGGVAYEQHSTYLVNFTHTIPVIGGGIIQFHTGDTNCHAIDNCGPGYFTTTCAANAGRTIPGVTIPATYLGLKTSVINPRTAANQPWHSHLLHLTVTAIK